MAVGTKMLRGYVERVERLVDVLGQFVAWWMLAMVATQFLVVVMRYAFDLGWIGLQESVVYIHAFVFMGAMAYTLRNDGHVRVDIFYRRMGARQRAVVDLIGTTLLLFPVCIFILVTSWDYVWVSWQRLEGSREAGGLPAVWALKSLMIVLPVLLMLQGSAWIGRALLCIRSSQGCSTKGDTENGGQDGYR